MKPEADRTHQARVRMIELGYARNMKDAEAMVPDQDEADRQWRKRMERERAALAAMPDTDPRFSART